MSEVKQRTPFLIGIEKELYGILPDVDDFFAGDNDYNRFNTHSIGRKFYRRTEGYHTIDSIQNAVQEQLLSDFQRYRNHGTLACKWVEPMLQCNYRLWKDGVPICIIQGIVVLTVPLVGLIYREPFQGKWCDVREHLHDIKLAW